MLWVCVCVSFVCNENWTSAIIIIGEATVVTVHLGTFSFSAHPTKANKSSGGRRSRHIYDLHYFTFAATTFRIRHRRQIIMRSQDGRRYFPRLRLPNMKLRLDLICV